MWFEWVIWFGGCLCVLVVFFGIMFVSYRIFYGPPD